jgi:hypothetical protein
MSTSSLATRLAVLALVLPALAACHRGAGAAWPSGDDPHGRYVGVGIYSPGAAWTRLIQSGRPSSAVAARLADDQAIIVTTDSATGELRACGDLSGYCVGFNPWKAPLPASQTAPAPLTVHAAEPPVTNEAPAAP